MKWCFLTACTSSLPVLQHTGPCHLYQTVKPVPQSKEGTTMHIEREAHTVCSQSNLRQSQQQPPPHGKNQYSGNGALPR